MSIYGYILAVIAFTLAMQASATLRYSTSYQTSDLLLSAREQYRAESAGLRSIIDWSVDRAVGVLASVLLLIVLVADPILGIGEWTVDALRSIPSAVADRARVEWIGARSLLAYLSMRAGAVLSAVLAWYFVDTLPGRLTVCLLESLFSFLFA